MTQQGTLGDVAPVPEVVGRYAAYLYAKAHLEAEITADTDRAQVRIATGGRALVLGFRRSGQGEWSLRRAEVQRGAQTATFTRGQVAKATALFLGDEPLTPGSPGWKGHRC
ncbi:MAG TPA: hypothetical protein VIV12_10920 [Streptosporangiaceae bacterium]